ncbi:glycosyltransferase [Bacteroidales bacterium OttesenSCG-928-A17]|nr:glycosyltransferase [Bacteroidales bacterium OttesenSCG-928-A17]
MPNKKKNQKKKLVSLVILTYNHETFIEETILGALSQNYSPLEIIISDDHSTDKTYEVVESVIKKYQGPHIVKTNRNENNMGLIPHLNKVLFELVNGDYILLNGGDDVSLPDRAKNVVSVLDKNPEMMGALFVPIIIDKTSSVTNKAPLEENDTKYVIDKDYLSAISFLIEGFSISFRKEVLDFFGKFNESCPTEDSTTHFRCMLLGGIISCQEYGILYRIHDTNMSRESNIYKLKTKPITNQYAKDLKCAYERNVITKATYRKLRKKIFYYGTDRSLSGKIYDSKGFARFFFRVCKKTFSLCRQLSF